MVLHLVPGPGCRCGLLSTSTDDDDARGARGKGKAPRRSPWEEARRALSLKDLTTSARFQGRAWTPHGAQGMVRKRQIDRKSVG